MNTHSQLFHAARGVAVFFGLCAVVCLIVLVVSISWSWTLNSPFTTYYVIVKCSNVSKDVEKNVQSTMIAENNITLDIWFSTFLFMVVPIRPSDQDSRQLIRDTWFEGFKNSQDVALRFALGTRTMPPTEQSKYTKENETFGDIIFVDMKEEFAALTNKTLAAINWAHRHVNFSYFMKCDDATYVFVKSLIDELKKRPTTTKLYYGDFMIDQNVIHHKQKWADNKWNLGSHYPPFARGGGYVISHDLVAVLSRDTAHLKWHVNEDAAIGAWLSSFDHERKSDGRFCLWWKGLKPPTCKKPILVLILHAFSDAELKKHFNHFHEQVSSNADVTLLL